MSMLDDVRLILWELATYVAKQVLTFDKWHKHTSETVRQSLGDCDPGHLGHAS